MVHLEQRVDESSCHCFLQLLPEMALLLLSRSAAAGCCRFLGADSGADERDAVLAGAAGSQVSDDEESTFLGVLVKFSRGDSKNILGTLAFPSLGVFEVLAEYSLGLLHGVHDETLLRVLVRVYPHSSSCLWNSAGISE